MYLVSFQALSGMIGGWTSQRENKAARDEEFILSQEGNHVNI